MWRRPDSKARWRLEVDEPFEPGQVVVVSMPERALLLAGLVLHGLPWLGLVAGAVAGGALLGSDLGALAGAIAALVAVALMMPSLRRRVEAETAAALRIQRAGGASR